MSVTGLSSSLYGNQSRQSEFQEFQQEFSQLGQDLQSGNLSAAQSDYVTLQSDAPQQNNSTNAPQPSNPIAQAFSQLSSALQSGNLSAAQQAYSTIQSGFQSQASGSGAAHGHHRHHHGGSSSEQSEIGELFSDLGSSLESGNLSSAQQDYATLQQYFAQFAQGNSSGTSTTGQSSSGTLSVNG